MYPYKLQIAPPYAAIPNWVINLLSLLFMKIFLVSRTSRTSQAASFMAELTRHGYPPALTSEQTEYLLSTIRDWAIANGLAVRPPSSDAAAPLAVTAPVTLFPSPFPRECFEEVRSIQTLYNELYALIARDEDWLKGIVEE